MELRVGGRRRLGRGGEGQGDDVRHALLAAIVEQAPDQRVGRGGAGADRLHQLALAEIAAHQLEKARLGEVVAAEHALEGRAVELSVRATEARHGEHRLAQRVIRHGEAEAALLLRDRRLRDELVERLHGRAAPHVLGGLDAAAEHAVELVHLLLEGFLHLRELDALPATVATAVLPPRLRITSPTPHTPKAATRTRKKSRAAQVLRKRRNRASMEAEHPRRRGAQL